MAERLDMPEGLGASERRSYPWDIWSDGNVWKLIEGVDYVERSRVIAAGRAYATRIGCQLRVSTPPGRGALMLQFVPRGDKAEVPS